MRAGHLAGPLSTFRAHRPDAARATLHARSDRWMGLRERCCGVASPLMRLPFIPREETVLRPLRRGRAERPRRGAPARGVLRVLRPARADRKPADRPGAQGRPHQPRHRPPTREDLRHAVRPRGHPGAHQPPRRHHRLHRGGRRYLHPLQDRRADPDRRAQAEIIVQQCEELVRGLEKLKGFKDVAPHWIEVHRLENEGDRIVRRAIADLFTNGTRRDGVIKWKDVYAMLEEAIDSCEDVANVIERIVVKHA